MLENAFQTTQFNNTAPKRAVRTTIETPVYPSGIEIEPDDDIPLLERPQMGFWQRIKPKTYEEKWAGAMGAIFALIVTGLLLMFFNGAEIRAQTPVSTPTQRPIMATPTIQSLESSPTPIPLQSAVETQTVAMVVNSAPEPVKEVLPSWATQECVLRIAGTVQGEAGGLGESAWYAIAQQLAWDSHECSVKVDYIGSSAPGTGNEVHTYDFECKKTNLTPECTQWSGRTSKQDDRTKDKGMVFSNLEAEVRPEILKVVTQSLVDFGNNKARYPDCEFTDNIEGMLLRVKQGATIDYIFTGKGNRTTETGAEFILNCPQGK